MKIISWNVNGIRAWYKKGCFNWILSERPDVFCVQETKAEKDQLPQDLLMPDEYYALFDSSKERRGHSGVAVYIKKQSAGGPPKPEKVTFGLGNKKFDQQGRQINVFFKDFVLINCYFPNGGGPTERLIKKLGYYEKFLKFVQGLRKDGRKVVFCGDLNVAHEEIDLARPESNKESVGFLPEERAWIDEYLRADFVDIFRMRYPDSVQYTYWDMKTRARDRNVGWRLDYFFVENSLAEKVNNIKIHDDVLGSDHAPVSMEARF